MRAPNDDHVGRVPFTDGAECDVYEDGGGRQYAVDGATGERGCGVWMSPTDDPVIVTGAEQGG